MKLLIVTQYFWPESFIINDLAKTLRRQGHHIVVATGKPNYPDGEVFAGYSAEGVQRDTFDGDIEVLRVPVRPRRTGGALNLFLNYLSFAWSGFWRFPALLRGQEFDAILAFCPSPITGAIPAIRLKWLKKAPLAVWIQDLWPESLEATGYVRSRMTHRLIGLMVRAIYGLSDLLLVQSRAFAAPVARYAARRKIVYYPNSVDARAFLSQEDGSAPRTLVELLESHFCVVFAGNLGTAQALSTIVEAAERLGDLPDVKIVLIGSGSMSDWIADQLRDRHLENVVLAGRFPASVMPEVYQRAGCLLVTLAKHQIFSFTVPSKVQGYLAAGRPIIAALDGEGARVVIEAGAGVTCGAEDAAALADCVRTVYGMSEAERAQLGASGKRYFMEHFEMDRQARQLVEILDRAARAHGEA